MTTLPVVTVTTVVPPSYPPPPSSTPHSSSHQNPASSSPSRRPSSSTPLPHSSSLPPASSQRPSASASQAPYQPSCDSSHIKSGSKVAPAPGFTCSQSTTTCTVGECCNLCTSNQGCVGWNYYPSNETCTLLLASTNMCPSFCVLSPQPAPGYDSGLGPCVSYPGGMPGWGY